MPIHHGNTIINVLPPHHWRGYYSWYSHHPYYYNYYPYYGSYPYDDSYLPSRSQIYLGASSSAYQPAPSSPAPSAEGATNPDKETKAVAELRMDLARRAFQKGDYAEAQAECERAIQLLPSDVNLKEFRALSQFAQGKYQDAADTLRGVLAVGHCWDWKTLRPFYTSVRTFTTQLRALERYVSENPKDPAGRLVLAYHCLVRDEREDAVRQLLEVTHLEPKDQVSSALVEALRR
jgi:tetratricopeptide (TPR) repeat protein